MAKQGKTCRRNRENARLQAVLDLISAGLDINCPLFGKRIPIGNKTYTLFTLTDYISEFSYSEIVELVNILLNQYTHLTFTTLPLSVKENFKCEVEKYFIDVPKDFRKPTLPQNSSNCLDHIMRTKQIDCQFGSLILKSYVSGKAKVNSVYYDFTRGKDNCVMDDEIKWTEPIGSDSGFSSTSERQSMDTVHHKHNKTKQNIAKPKFGALQCVDYKWNVNDDCAPSIFKESSSKLNRRNDSVCKAVQTAKLQTQDGNPRLVTKKNRQPSSLFDGPRKFGGSRHNERFDGNSTEIQPSTVQTCGLMSYECDASSKNEDFEYRRAIHSANRLLLKAQRPSNRMSHSYLTPHFDNG